MATTQRQVMLNEPPEAAVQTCVRALMASGFKNVTSAQGFVVAQKRPFGQWTKSQITLNITGDGTQSRVDIAAEATAQSLTGLASSPSRRMVDEVARALGAAAASPPAAGPVAAPGAAETSEMKTCPRCAEEVKAAAQVCRFCGHSFEAVTEETMPTSEQ